MSGGGGVATEDIDLSDVWGDGVERGRGGNEDCALAFSTVPIFLRESGSGDAAEEAGVVIGGGAEDIADIIEAEAPGVVVKLVNEFEIRAVFLEAVDTHAEFLAVIVVGGVADGSPELVIEAVAEIGGASVGVSGAPATEDDFADVGLVVAIGVF